MAMTPVLEITNERVNIKKHIPKNFEFFFKSTLLVSLLNALFMKLFYYKFLEILSLKLRIFGNPLLAETENLAKIICKAE